MNKIYFPLVIFITFLLADTNYAQINHVVQVSNFIFTPSSLTITLGDTVTWKWVSGTHTTTSDSTSGVDSWDAPINSSQQTFKFVIKHPGMHKYYCKFHGTPQGTGMAGSINATKATGITENRSIPNNYILFQNYPNPFNPTTGIKYAIPTQSIVTIEVFDVVGNKVETLLHKGQGAGYYNIQFNGSDLPSGIYFLQLKANNFFKVKKMVLLK